MADKNEDNDIMECEAVEEGGEDEDDEKMKSESDDDEEEDDEKETRMKLKEIDEILAKNPYEYNSHVSKIKLLKSLGELEELRAARNEFSNRYPLSPELWLDWLKDEQKLVSTPEERKFVTELFDKAVKDYISVELWMEYCQFVLGDIATEAGIEKARAVFERAVSSVGLHVAKGGLIWDTYREFENALVAMKMIPNSELLYKVFLRQLSQPLLNMEGTFEEYIEWEKQNPDFQKNHETVKSAYDSAHKKLKDREPFEDNLMNEDKDEKFEKYRDYIEFESKSKDSNPVRLQSLYERRITDYCLDPRVWIEYLEYLDRKLKIDSVSLPVHERAVRNCPWSAEIWISYLRALERYEQPQKEVIQILEQALCAGFVDPKELGRVWLAYLDYIRRKTDFDDEKSQEQLRTIFRRAYDHVSSVTGADPECKIARYWASIEADRLRNMEDARKLWADVSGLIGSTAQIWPEYINLEKMFGDSKHIRRVFIRALEKTQDYPELIADIWLQFEREEGTLEQFEDAEDKIKTKLQKTEEKRKIEAEIEAGNLKRKDQKIDRKKEKDKQVRRDRRQHESSERKRKFGVVERPDLESLAKVAKKQNDDDDDTFKVPLPMDDKIKPGSEKEGIKPPPGFKKEGVKPPPGFEEAQQNSDKVTGENDEKKDMTIFLSNLVFSVDEDAIKAAMEKSGKVVDVRLAKNHNGKSRGFAFVEFSTPSEAKHAIGRDHEELEGRPMFISKCEPNKQGHQFKYGTGLEKNKLFVKNLNFQTTKEHLEKLFSGYGKLKDVRLVTYRNGKSKGLAFIEFDNENDASTALLKTDGMKFQGHELSVAISNPPEKKKEPPSPLISSLGGGQKELGPRGRGRTQVAFVPRALLTKTEVHSNGSGEQKTIEKKSNADFRALLNK